MNYAATNFVFLFEPGDGGCELHLELCSLWLSEWPRAGTKGSNSAYPDGVVCNKTKSTSLAPLELLVRERQPLVGSTQKKHIYRNEQC